MISTIIFDLSEVYLRGMFGIEEKISKEIKSLVPSDFIYKSKAAEEFFYGKITENEFWNRLITKNNWPITTEVLKNMVREQMTEIEGTRIIMEELYKKGYKMGLLSIHGREWVDHLEKRFDYHRLFHSRMYSFEVGVAKPDPKAFELILEALNAKPSDCLFIDDYDVNIHAAKELGISTILFENARQLKESLRDFEIIIA